MPNKNEEHSAMPTSLINAFLAYISIQFLLIKDKQKFPLTKQVLGSSLLSRAISKSVYHFFCWVTELPHMIKPLIMWTW